MGIIMALEGFGRVAGASQSAFKNSVRQFGGPKAV